MMRDADVDNAFEPLDPDRLTWAVLLARWTDFARAAVALPEDDDEAGRVRRSVADIIALQAVWFALRDLDALPAEQRAIGLDRAGVLIDYHESALQKRFVDAKMPVELVSLIEDVIAAYTGLRARLNN